MRLRGAAILSVLILFALGVYSSASFAVFNLSPMYVRAKAIVYKTINTSASTLASGWITGKRSGPNFRDGGFTDPFGIAVDATNDAFYVADGGSGRVQKFVLSTAALVGTIGASTAGGTCVAGKQNGWCTGGAYYQNNGDGMFDYVSGIAVDPIADALYVSDNYRVQKFVASTGAHVGTIGNSTASGTCIAGKQNGWCTGGTFSQGSGDGMFSQAYAMAIDNTANVLLIADYSNFRVQKFNLTTGAFVGAIGWTSGGGTCATNNKQSGWCTGGTFAGSLSGDGSVYSPSGIALDAANDYFYVVDSSQYMLQRFVLSTGAHSGSIGWTSGGGTCASNNKQSGWCTGGTFVSKREDGGFYSPFAVTIDTVGGHLFVSDEGSHRVQRFTLAGAAAGAVGMASTAGANSCNITGPQTGWCSGATWPVTGATFEGAFKTPLGLGIAGTKLYVVDYNNYRVQRFAISTGAYEAFYAAISTPANGWSDANGLTPMSDPINGGFAGPTEIAIDKVNNLMYVSDISRVSKFTLSTGVFVGAIGHTSGGGTCATGAQAGWCSGGTFVATTADGGFGTAPRIAIDVANDALYTADGSRVQKFTLSTGAHIGTIGNSIASGTCISGKQNGWCTGGVFSNGNGDGQLFGGNPAVAVGAGGAIYVADPNNHRIQRFTSAGAFDGAIGKSTAAGSCSAGAQATWCTGGTFSSGSGSGMFNTPRSIAVDATGDALYVADNSNYRIMKFTASTGLYVGSIGNVTVAAGTCRAGRQLGWCTGSNFTSASADGQFSAVIGIGIDPAANTLYAASGYRVMKFSLSSGGFVGTIGQLSSNSGNCKSGTQYQWCTGGSGFSFVSGIPPIGYLQNPTHVASANGFVYIVDNTSQRILRLSQ